MFHHMKMYGGVMIINEIKGFRYNRVLQNVPKWTTPALEICFVYDIFPMIRLIDSLHTATFGIIWTLMSILCAS